MLPIVVSRHSGTGVFTKSTGTPGAMIKYPSMPLSIFKHWPNHPSLLCPYSFSFLHSQSNHSAGTCEHLLPLHPDQTHPRRLSRAQLWVPQPNIWIWNAPFEFSLRVGECRGAAHFMYSRLLNWCSQSRLERTILKVSSTSFTTCPCNRGHVLNSSTCSIIHVGMCNFTQPNLISSFKTTLW